MNRQQNPHLMITKFIIDANKIKRSFEPSSPRGCGAAGLRTTKNTIFKQRILCDAGTPNPSRMISA